MKTDIAQINLVLAWLWILLGFLTGMGLGLIFHREHWLGGYGSFKRRMYRLAHISFFGLGAVNLFFWLTVIQLPSASLSLTVASWAFVVGAVTMPVCCVVMAHWPRWHPIFSVPVVSLLVGGGLMCAAVVRIDNSETGQDSSRLSPTLNVPLHLVGMRPTRVPHFLPARWGRGGTRPYQVHAEGERFEYQSPLLSRTSNQSIPTNLNLFQP